MPRLHISLLSYCSILLPFLLLSPARAESPLPPLRVGMELSYPPFEMTDTQGKPQGISVEIAQALGRHLRREVVISNTSFDGLIPSLKTGKIDLIISSMTATEERARSIAFSQPYLTTGLSLLTQASAPSYSVTELNQAGKVIAVKKGTTGHLYATRHLKQAKLLILDKESSAVLEVLQKKADVFIYDQLSIHRHAQEHPEKLKALLHAFQTESWAIGLRLGDTQLKESVNQFLDQFRQSGGFARLGDQYLGETKKAFLSQGVPFVF
jgi:polar amino acid transport system substrate-binding protein